MKKAENKDIGGLIFDIEPLIFKLESLSSLCLVINNALESGSTSEEQYYPAIFLLGDQLAELHKKWRKRLRRCKKPIRARGEARQMRTETMAKEKAAATANSNRQSKRLPVQRSQFQYTIGNAAFQAKHKNGPEMPCKAFEPENGKGYPQKFLTFLNGIPANLNVLRQREGSTKHKTALQPGYSLALCLVVISINSIPFFHASL